MKPVSGVLGTLIDYWLALPRNGTEKVPPRTAIRPLDLHRIVPRITILKRLEKDNILVSVVETGSDCMLTSPMIGINAYDLASPGMLEDTTKIYETVLDHPSGALLHETVLHQDGLKADIASLFLPLTDTKGANNYIMSYSVRENADHNTEGVMRQRLGHQDIHKIDFIDIGCGHPSWVYKKPIKAAPRLPIQQLKWWDRLLQDRTNIQKDPSDDRRPLRQYTDIP